MGWRTVADVRDYSTARGTTYTVLLMLAERAPDETRIARPGLKLLAEDARTTRSTVQRALKWLEEHDEIEAVAFREGGRGKATEWRIAVTAPEPDDGERVSDCDPAGGAEKGVTSSGKGVTSRTKGGTGATPTGEEPKGTEPLSGLGAAVPSLDEQIASSPWAEVLRLLRPVAESKRAELDVEKVAEACAKFADRAHVHEATRFAEWWLRGRGMNRSLRALARAWSTWLSQSPTAEVATGGAGNVRGIGTAGVARHSVGPTGDDLRRAAEEARRLERG